MKEISNELEEIVQEMEQEPKKVIKEPSNKPLIHIKRRNFRRFLILLLVVITICGMSGAYYLYEKINIVKSNPNLVTQKESERLVSVLGQLIELPKNETPTIATVLDKNKLKGQEFFNGVENGDKLFVYDLLKKAILYRPSLNKIINIAPITVNQTQPSVEQINKPVVSTSTILRIAYYNGTNKDGIAGATEKIVKSKYPTWVTSSLSSAAKKNYKETLVVDISGDHKQEADQLAYLLGGKISSLPAGETATSTDILIISAK